jgi:hypothetical protein
MPSFVSLFDKEVRGFPPLSFERAEGNRNFRFQKEVVSSEGGSSLYKGVILETSHSRGGKY